MSKDVTALDRMVDYVKQLRRHTEGRRAVHIRLSALERHFREEHYRLFAASALRNVITRFGATMFALPNTDLVLITKDARVDDIDPALNAIRRKLRDSALIASLDPVQGSSDEFVVWFDIEDSYDDFKDYVEQLSALLQLGESAQEAESQALEAPRKGRLKRPSQQDIPVTVRRSSHVRMMPVTPMPKEKSDTHLDPDLLLTLTKALQGADVAGLLRKQFVKAILGSAPPMPVLEHKFVPRPLVYQTLLTSRVLSENRWLCGYLDDHLGRQILASTPAMGNEISLASSIKVTSASVLSGAFDAFEKSLGKHPRSKIVLEFGAVDIMSNPVDYQEASRHVLALGYRISVGDLHPLAFLALDVEPMQAAFVKILKPVGTNADWLNSKTETAIQNKIERIGKARVILDGCEETTDIDLGHLLGITLFQGHAVDPMVEA
ncbi:hypothetical protein [Kordiimonas aestuarii]|uniref:hypothetical protein n=1 Tax=Kordiimonas aestuarii TaxID=1005925 RepID=UPI0021CE8E5C|nr:hypothetical protein [Kordiimonas aestuarii]